MQKKSSLTPRISHLLQSSGYALKKGDAAKVSAAIPDDKPVGSVTDYEIFQAAESCSIQKKANFYVPASLDPELSEAAYKWIADHTVKVLSSTNATDTLLDSIFDEVIKGHRARIREEINSYDYSTFGVATKTRYDLSAYETIQDFLDEPTGSTKATFESGMGMSVVRQWQELDRFGYELVINAMKQAGRDGQTMAPEPIQTFLAGMDHLDDFSIDDSVYDRVSQLGYCESSLLHAISVMPFRATLLQRHPEVAGRLAKDVAAAEYQEQVHTRAQASAKKKVDEIVKQFSSGVRAERIEEVLLAIVRDAVDKDGLSKAHLVAADHRIAALFDSKKTAKKFRSKWEEWCGLMEDVDQINFSGPWIRLFLALEVATRHDERSWYLTVVTRYSEMTFASDNWAFFLAFCLTQEPSSESYVVMARRFEKERDAVTGYPYKTVIGMTICEDEITPLMADVVQEAFSTDATTGKRISQEPLVRFGNATSVLPDLFSLSATTSGASICH